MVRAYTQCQTKRNGMTETATIIEVFSVNRPLVNFNGDDENVLYTVRFNDESVELRRDAEVAILN